MKPRHIQTGMDRRKFLTLAGLAGAGLAGGGALLANLDILIKEKTGLPVALAEDPLTCVVRGSGKALQDMDLLRKVTIV